jgi:hypothetical protein
MNTTNPYAPPQVAVQDITDSGEHAKKIVGIKLVRSDGAPVSVARVFWLRNVLNTAIGM